LATQDAQATTTTVDEISSLNNWLPQNTPLFTSKTTGTLWVKLAVHNTTAKTKSMALVLEAPLLTIFFF